MSQDSFSWDCPFCGCSTNVATASVNCRLCKAEVEVNIYVTIDHCIVISDGEESLKMRDPEEPDPNQLTFGGIA